jgi:hypothetical protein
MSAQAAATSADALGPSGTQSCAQLRCPTTASAQTEGDGRAVTTEAEYRAVFWHITRRYPTPEETEVDNKRTAEEHKCSWGVVESA